MAKLTKIEGIGEVLAGKLKNGGVGSVESLLQAGSTARGRKELAHSSGIDNAQILKFVNHADLMRIKGVGGQYAELLEAAGVDTVVELSHRNGANLHKMMKEVNDKTKLVRQLPARSQVEGWVTGAGQLPRAVTY